MKAQAIAIFWTLVSLLVIFAVLDFFNLTAWLVYPISTLTKKNTPLTTAMGNTPTLFGNPGNS